MKTFVATLLAATGIASSVEQFGSTGHVGNGFAHKGTKDHDPQDHSYGYDSVPVNFDLGDQTTLAGNIKTQVLAANEERLNYIDKVYRKRVQRLTEMHQDNVEKIDAPFDYQIRLIGEEENDVLQARNEALRDSNDAFSDLLFRLESFADDIKAVFDDEISQIGQAVQRAQVDHKNPCAVLFALRINWLSEIEGCDAGFRGVTNGAIATEWPGYNGAGTPPLPSLSTTLSSDPASIWGEYDTIFSDFHYDIGHGKATGSGSIDSAPIVDGFRNGNLQASARGDRQVQVGAPTHVWERPGSQNRRRF